MPGISTYCETNCHHPFAQNREGGCHRLFFVAQHIPSYYCPYDDHTYNAELEDSQQRSLQFRLDDFRFLSGWTHKEGSEMLKTCRS
jgi:hypothetical protein